MYLGFITLFIKDIWFPYFPTCCFSIRILSLFSKYCGTYGFLAPKESLIIITHPERGAADGEFIPQSLSLLSLL